MIYTTFMICPAEINGVKAAQNRFDVAEKYQA